MLTYIYIYKPTLTYDRPMIDANVQHFYFFFNSKSEQHLLLLSRHCSWCSSWYPCSIDVAVYDLTHFILILIWPHHHHVRL